MSELVESSWRRIVAWLEANAAELLDEARPGQSAEDISRWATSSGLEPPDDLRRFLGLINGAEGGGIFPSRDDFDEMAYSPMSADEIRTEWNSQNELLEGGDFDDLQAEPDEGVAADWWNRGWIPFATNGGGDYFCVDTAPAAGGTAGQIIAHSHESGERRKLAESLGAYLNQLADDIDAGDVHYDEDCGLVAAIDDE